MASISPKILNAVSILIFIIMLVNHSSACEVSFIQPNPGVVTQINPGEDIEFRVSLNPELLGDCSNIPVELEVIDPLGGVHTYTWIRDYDDYSSPIISFKRLFTHIGAGSSITEEYGRYYATASIREDASADVGNTWDRLSFSVGYDQCDLDSEIYMGDYLAKRTVTIGSVPEETYSELVECCDVNECCLTLELDDNCIITGGNFPPVNLEETLIDPTKNDKTVICRKFETTGITYYSIDPEKYRIIGRDNTDGLKFTIIDLDDCIIGDTDRCDLSTKNLLIKKTTYGNYLNGELLTSGTILCNGFYEFQGIPIFTAEQYTPRYSEVYGQEYTNELYCYQMPEVISESSWCYEKNFEWYTAVTLKNKEGFRITPDNTDEANTWNKLAGTIVLGHVCPINFTESDPTAFASGTVYSFDAEAGDYGLDSIECEEPYHVPNDRQADLEAAGLDSCIYTWRSDLDGYIGFQRTFTKDDFSTNSHTLTLKAASNETDTQIPVREIIDDSVNSIRTHLDVKAITSTCAPIDTEINLDATIPTTPTTEDQPEYYRLFEENKTWVKIFAVSPRLDDIDTITGTESWNLDWSSASTGDEEKKITVYVGAGCKRLPAAYFTLSDTDHVDVEKTGYPNEIDDYINISIDDGQNPIAHYSRIDGRNILPFPPADAVEDEDGNVVSNIKNPYDGARYSFFAFEYTVPENAAYLNISVNYSCETELVREWITAVCPAPVLPDLPQDEITDTSIVEDYYTIRFLDHENTRDNCKWSSPPMWEEIAGEWIRVFDNDLQKHVFQLNANNSLTQKIMVSKEPIDPDDKLFQVRVKAIAGAGDNPDTTVGFYSDKTGENYWYVNLDSDSLTYQHKLTLGECIAGVCTPKATPTVPPIPTFIGGDWYTVKLSLNENEGNYNIAVKVWEISLPEPEEWQVEYTISAAEHHGSYWLIGTIDGTDSEAFKFDPEPDCGIEVSGYYDVVDNGITGDEFISGGKIRINAIPDIISGVELQLGDEPKAEYSRIVYPSTHNLYKKASAIEDLETTYHYSYFDKYGSESTDYGYDPKCTKPICPSNCKCSEGDVFNPMCTSTDGSQTYRNEDCICLPDQCYHSPFTEEPDPCGPTRDYHEFEGAYYDFIDFETYYLPETDHGTTRAIADAVNFRRISFNNMESESTQERAHQLDIERIGASRGDYNLFFSAENIEYPDFQDEGKLIVYTHYQIFEYDLKDILVQRKPAEITYEISSSGEEDNIESGDDITVTVDLKCKTLPLEGEKVQVLATNYENALSDVITEEGKSYIITEAGGQGSFTFTIKKDAATLTLNYPGGDSCGPATVVTTIGGTSATTTLLDVNFFLLLIIFVMAVFAYRFFKRNRLDFFEAWQEFKGEKE